MTKAAKARRRRAERQELNELRLLKQRLSTGGTQVVDSISFNDSMHVAMSVATKLGYCIMLRRADWFSGNTWRAVAIKP